MSGVWVWVYERDTNHHHSWATSLSMFAPYLRGDLLTQVEFQAAI